MQPKHSEYPARHQFHAIPSADTAAHCGPLAGGISMSTLAETAPRSGWYHGWNIIGAGVLVQVAVNGLALNSFSLFLHNWSVDLNSPISTLQVAFVLIGVMNAA